MLSQQGPGKFLLHETTNDFTILEETEKCHVFERYLLTFSSFLCLSVQL